jgi:hypothetical protein
VPACCSASGRKEGLDTDQAVRIIGREYPPSERPILGPEEFCPVAVLNKRDTSGE